MHHPLQYPKLLGLFGSFILAYILLEAKVFEDIAMLLNGHGYISIFLAGLLFSFGFTSPFALGMFIELAPSVAPLIAAPVAGLGALAADFFLFEIMRFSFFHEEINRIRTTVVLRRIEALLHHERLSEKLRRYVLWSFAGIIIASPLPDEIGVTLVSGITRIDVREFTVICFLFNAFGIFAILSLTRALA